MRRVQERLDAEVLRLVADCDAVDAWYDDGLGPVSWVASKTGLVRGAAARLVKTARFLARHAQTAKALDAGDVSVPHVELLAAAAHRREDLYAEHETVLLDPRRHRGGAGLSCAGDATLVVARRRRARAA